MSPDLLPNPPPSKTPGLLQPFCLEVANLNPSRHLARHAFKPLTSPVTIRIDNDLFALERHRGVLSQHHVRDVDFGSFEPLVCAHEPPDQDAEHGTAVYEACPVHARCIEVGTSDDGQTEDWDHERDECRCDAADWDAEAAEVPGAGAEPVADKEDADEDWCRKGDESGNGTDTKECANGQGATEDHQKEKAADYGIEPDGVDWRFGGCVDVFPIFRKWEAIVASISKRHPAGGDHATLAHCETCDDGQG